jgi:iron complex outermembrane recepter protein
VGISKPIAALIGSFVTVGMATGAQAQVAGESAPTASEPPAAAQGPGGTAAPQEVPGDLSTITVTARKRDESLMAVPVVVTALSAETLQKYNAVNLEAIGDLTPTVIVANYKINGGGSIAIRGISSPANQVGFEQDVSVAVDGIQSSNGQIAQLGFFDLQQVEVLKGPQALFFGKNNTAGVISLTSAGPTDHFEASVRSGWEFYGRESITDAAVSGPLTDTLSARLAVRYRNLGGYLTNTAAAQPNPFYSAASGAPASVGFLPGATDTRAGESEFLGRLTLKYKPSEDLTATLRISGDRDNDDGGGVATQNIGPCTGGFPRVNGVPDKSGDCVPDNRTTIGNVPPAYASTVHGQDINADGSPSGELGVMLASLNIDANLNSFLSLSSLTGFNRLRYIDFSGDDQTTFSQLVVYEDQVQQDISQELRLSSKFHGPVNFVVGGFVQHTARSVINDNKLNDAQYNAAVNRYSAFNSNATQPGNTDSIFGQLIWNVTSSIEAAGGARWTQETKDFEKYNYYGVGAFDTLTTVYPGSSQPGVLSGHFKDDNVSPEGTITWRPDNDHTIFAAYRTGFKSGGFGMTNPLQKTTTIDAVNFGSETAHGFEVGARGLFFNRRLNLSADIFDYEFKNLQVNIYDPATISFNIDNAGLVKQKGAELEANFRATDVVTLHGAMAYVHDRFSNFIGQCYSYTFPTGATRATAVPPPNCSFANTASLTLQQVFDGRAPARAPDLSGNAGFDVTVPIGNLKAGLTGDSYFSGSYYSADTLAPPTLQHAYFTYNASASIGDTDDRWKVSLIGRNLSNKYYVLYAVDRTGGAGVPGSIGEQRGAVSRGRELTLEAEVKF